MSRPLHIRAVHAETIQLDGRTEESVIHPLASRFEMMAVRSQTISPRLGQMLGVLLDAARPFHRGGRAVLQPLWAEEATHRAYNTLHLVMKPHQSAGVRPENDVALRLEREVANDLATLFRTLDIGKDDEVLPCSWVLRGVVRNLVALFGSGAGPVVIRTDIERLSLPAYKRRALVLAASELVINALRNGFAGKCGGQIQVTLHAFGTAHACLTVVDDGVGIQQNRPSGNRGISSELADLLEADLVYRRLKIHAGYRVWQLVAVAHESGLDELRTILGNPVAVTTYRQGTLPFPASAIIAELAWKHMPLPRLDGAFVTGTATTVQIMVKDSKKYAATGGRGIRPVHRWQTRRRGAARSLLPLLRDARKRVRLRFCALRTLRAECYAEFLADPIRLSRRQSATNHRTKETYR